MEVTSTLHARDAGFHVTPLLNGQKKEKRKKERKKEKRKKERISLAKIRISAGIACAHTVRTSYALTPADGPWRSVALNNGSQPVGYSSTERLLNIPSVRNSSMEKKIRESSNGYTQIDELYFLL